MSLKAFQLRITVCILSLKVLMATQLVADTHTVILILAVLESRNKTQPYDCNTCCSMGNAKSKSQQLKLAWAIGSQFYSWCGKVANKTCRLRAIINYPSSSDFRRGQSQIVHSFPLTASIPRKERRKVIEIHHWASEFSLNKLKSSQTTSARITLYGNCLWPTLFYNSLSFFLSCSFLASIAYYLYLFVCVTWHATFWAGLNSKLTSFE